MRPRSLAPLAAALLAGLAPVVRAAAEDQPPPTVAEAEAFYQRAEGALLAANVRAERAAWVNETYITDDTEALVADAEEAVLALTSRLVDESRRFDGLALPPALARKQLRLRLSLSMPGPRDAARRAELTRLAAKLGSTYGKAKACPDAGPYRGRCLGQPELEEAFAKQRDPKVLQDLWLRWHANGAALKEDYVRFVGLADEGARDLGFADVGELWRSGYDMPPERFRAEVHRLWGEVRPLYVALHAYVRARLVERYGPAVVPPAGPLPVHLLGNVWGQEWDRLSDLVAPPGRAGGPDADALLARRKTTPEGLVRYGERFFQSLGFAPLPDTFWRRSQLVRPRDREVVCHASAWDVDQREDLRLKMCIQVGGHDFTTVHHELGHLMYDRAYMEQPPLLRGGANDGFHEAIGDAVALSVTPGYLQRLGLVRGAKGEAAQGDDVRLLLDTALEDVAILPWTLLVDEWRWKVFSGEVKPEDYGAAWWRLRAEYEGVAPPVARTAADFDPGAKYHVPANVPYMRYFLAAVLKFQFYRGMCRAAGYEGPLHRCSVYGSKPAGERFRAMLALGASKPWPEALSVLTGEDHLDAGALREYFAPLEAWLAEQNRGKPVGW